MGFNYQVLYGDSATLSKAGYDKVAHIPCILDARPGYHRYGSYFLIDYALGLWDSTSKGKVGVTILPSTKTIKNCADRLANFLEWCETKKLEPMQADYNRDLIGSYQVEMLRGTWARDGKPLAERTINVRVDVAISYLNWASFKGLRSSLIVPRIGDVLLSESKECYPADYDHKQKKRKGKLPELSPRLTLPPEGEIIAWRQRVQENGLRGQTDVLIVDLILETAIRREEAACWRVDTLPINRSDWNIVNYHVADENKSVFVEICYGAKGHEYGISCGDKIGPRSIIRLPYSMALRLHNYRDRVRSNALAKAIVKGKTVREQNVIKDESVHLFLNPVNGKRYSGDDIYEFWRAAKPPKSWSPHKARHYWACCLLWDKMRQQRALIESAPASVNSEVLFEALQSSLMSVIRLQIQPQLRHKSENTSLIYLQWFSDQLMQNMNFHERWATESFGGIML